MCGTNGEWFQWVSPYGHIFHTVWVQFNEHSHELHSTHRDNSLLCTSKQKDWFLLSSRWVYQILNLDFTHMYNRHTWTHTQPHLLRLVHTHTHAHTRTHTYSGMCTDECTHTHTHTHSQTHIHSKSPWSTRAQGATRVQLSYRAPVALLKQFGRACILYTVYWGIITTAQDTPLINRWPPRCSWAQYSTAQQGLLFLLLL